MKKVETVLLGLTAMACAAPAASAQSFYEPRAEAVSLAAFGGTLAVAEGQVLVGEPSNVMRPGLVYVYARDASGNWSEVQQLRGPAAEMGDGFGSSLAVSGTTLLVGAPDGVHVFERDASGTWAGAGHISVPDSLGDEAGFGAALALDGALALVGAPGVQEQTGAVYLYRRSADAWTPAGTVAADGLAQGDVFGAALALEGGRALIGAPLRDARKGAVFAYRVDAGALTLEGTLPNQLVQPDDRFGASIHLRGDIAVVGAPFHANAQGAAFRYVLEEDEWTTAGRLAAFDGQSRDVFGMAMASTDDQVWIGSPRQNAAYVFHMEDGIDEIVRVEKVTSDELSGRGQMASTLATEGDLLAAGAPGEDGGAGSVVVFERGSDGAWSEVAVLESAPEGFDPVAGGEVTCEEGEAVVWDCSEVDLVSFVPVSQLAGEEGIRGIRTNDNWGWEDPETGRTYALVGMTDRASFVDITDPVNPRVVGILPMTEGASGSAWRDIKTYEDHAFIVSDGAGQHGMQVFDLSRLREADNGEPVVFDEDALYTEIASAHNIVINEDTGYAFSVGSSSGGETCGGGLHIIDIRDPLSPSFAGCFADPQTGRASTGYTHDAQCVTYSGPDEEHQGREICFGANETALSIADVTRKDSTVALSRAAYPNVGYSHQGWLTEDQRFFYMNDELDEIQGSAAKTRTMIWDVTDLDDPQLVAEHMGTEEASDHNLYVVGDLMYQSNYRSGLRILDISDPAAPVEVAYFDTVPYGDNSAGMGGSWSNYPFFDNGVVIVTSGNEGLFMVRPTNRRTVF